MELREFLKTQTNPCELCVIRDNGWVIASVWIDYEDLFVRYLSDGLEYREVKKHWWGDIAIVNENNAKIRIPCHYVDV